MIRSVNPSDSGWLPHWRYVGRGFFNVIGELTMNKRTSLKKLRYSAFLKQAGKCFYCRQPMWEEDQGEFAKRHGLTLKQSRLFQSTGEHLIPHAQGGQATPENLVAACFNCNHNRHKHGRNLAVNAYLNRVKSRMCAGKWHAFRATKVSVHP